MSGRCPASDNPIGEHISSGRTLGGEGWCAWCYQPVSWWGTPAAPPEAQEPRDR